MLLQGTLPLAACLGVAMLVAPQAPAQTPAQLPTPSPTPSAASATATTTSVQQAPDATPQAFPTGHDTPLGDAINTLLREPTAARAHWGIAITQLDGTPVYGLEEGKLFRPASTAKLFTTAGAMALLGPDARFTTSLYGNLNAGTGVVKGDLVLVGGGDPSFGTTDLATEPTDTTNTANKPAAGDLNELVAQLLAKGVHSVTGNVVGDEELFAQEQPPEGWAAEDLTWGYGALPNALSFGDNQLHLTIKAQPGSARSSAPPKTSAAMVQLDQLVPYFRLSNNVTVEPPEPGARDHVDVQPVPGHPRELVVLGTLSPGAGAVSEHIAVTDPAQYAAEALRFTLTQRAVRISGKATATHSVSATPQPFLQTLRTPDDCVTSAARGAPCSLDCLRTPHPEQLLAQHTSAPLATDVKFTLKTSANLHAEIFLRQLEVSLTCGGASSLGGARILRAWLLQAGLADHDFLLYDGSGLSTKDLVTPRAEARLLAFAATQPWYAAWKAGLPIAGVDGTLAGRFTTSLLKGKVFAKTGTLGETRALAGYVQCASGRELIFSILEDNHDPSDSADRQTAEKILEAVAAAN